jgi:uncharacterized membrane protein
MKKKDLLILIIPLIILAVIYPFLPARIPRQFSFTGKPTSYMAKEFIFLLGLLPYLIYRYYKPKNNV